jgi:tetratricopeptide (TPR) repeat protein
VRHRSELAASLNNLGVVYCRAKQPADADAAFERARSLLATLAHDYPDELAYSSSWAALLNNQAMALAEADRHEDALRWYPTAIEIQRKCWQRSPDAMSDPLSKIYYNYGQSLRRTGKLAAAAQTAIARRDVWSGNGPRLFGVAVELAEIARLGEPNAADHETRKLHEEIITTLAASRDAGGQSPIQLAEDERFKFLRQNKQFEQLIADWPRQAPAVESRTPGSQPTSYRTKN